jgi:hypothetical protein
MKIRDIAADLIGAIAIFGLLWAGFVFAYGMGW